MSVHSQERGKFLAETSLDPVDWEAFSASAHKALNDAIEFLKGARERPVWLPVPDDVRAALSTPLPQTGQSLDQVYQEFTRLILPYSTGNTHPRFFGWVHGTGMANGIIAEMLAAALNANCGGRDHGAIYVEHAVLGWFKELFHLPDQASGLIVSGTSIANLIALAVARNTDDVWGMRTDGLQERPGRLIAYTSVEAHECLVKAMEVLGLGANQLRRVPVDNAYRMDLGSLCEQIEADRAAGYRPFCVIGTAGTVNTAAIDDLAGLAEICAKKKLWFHVDGAFGSLAMMCEELRSKLHGIERADSIAFDFHKWMHVPYDAGCILVRNGDLHRASFSMRPAYLSHLLRGLAGGRDWPCEFGLELSRSFRALKIWFALKEHGSLRFGRSIAQNCAQAQYLAEAIAGNPDLELLAPVSLNIVCFRYRIAQATDAELDALNEAIVEDIQEAGIAAPSTTRLRGRLAIRVNITNHRTRREDLDLLLRSVIEGGHQRQLARDTDFAVHPDISEILNT